MQELKFEQVEDVNGGVIPFIVAVVFYDAALIATMALVQSAMREK